jgi:hypothetical protein
VETLAPEVERPEDFLLGEHHRVRPERHDGERIRRVGFLAGEPERRVDAGDRFQASQIERGLNIPAVAEEGAREHFRIRAGAGRLVIVDRAVAEPVQPRAAPEILFAPDQGLLRLAVEEHRAAVMMRGELHAGCRHHRLHVGPDLRE